MEKRTCPSCGAELKAEILGGQCPKCPRAKVGSGRWAGRVFLVGLLALVAFLSVEHFRGRIALARWKKLATAKGKELQPAKFWPLPPAGLGEFSNRFSLAVRDIPQAPILPGAVLALVPAGPGQARIGSQLPSPALTPSRGASTTWKDLDGQLKAAEPALREIRTLLKNPPATAGGDVEKLLRVEWTPSYTANRITAQALHAAAVNELRRGRLDAAAENLIALAAVAQLYRDDPTLVNQMVRVAVVGIASDTVWAALQSPGWTDPPLAAVQRAWESVFILTNLVRAFQFERATMLYHYDEFRRLSYEEWIQRHELVYKSFGLSLPDSASPTVRFWRHWAIHPLWSFAWAEQEQVLYLKASQPELEAISQALAHPVGPELMQRLGAIHRNYRPPMAAWRFYGRLPLLSEIGSAPPVSTPPAQLHWLPWAPLLEAWLRVKLPGRTEWTSYPYPVFTNAWRAGFRNLTRHQMMLAAIALKRYEMRHGQPPADLRALVPEFLSMLPLDFMNGQPLRYRRHAEGGYTLYSVGEDSRDDGGDPTSGPDKSPASDIWEGRDAVWPKPLRKNPL